MNILVGGILQEGNTFSPLTSTIEDFRQNFFIEGDKLREPSTIHNELLGFQQVIEEQGATLIPTLFASAVSSGGISRSSLDWFKQAVIEWIERAPAIDGVLFALHGAQIAEGCEDPEGELLIAIREEIGKSIPIVITLDSHANVTQKMVEQINGLVGYRTFPHVDFKETAYRAGQLLFSILRGEVKPHVTLRKVPMILPAENQQTYSGPMAELLEEAAEGERLGQSIVTSLFAVQPWLDIAEMGFSVVVVGEDQVRNEQESSRLAKLAWEKRREFDVSLFTVPQVLAILAEQKHNGPVIVSDSADSPGAGSPGDSNFVLRELLHHQAEQRWKCLLTMVDAQGVSEAIEAGVGSSISLTLGHSISKDSGTPLKIQGIVQRVGDGKFRFGEGFQANLVGNMGRAVVVQMGGISLLLTERAVFTGDPAMYRSMGLEPTEVDLVMVKSACQFRSSYEKLSEHIYILDTPGASTANLQSLPYVNIARPMYPWDQDLELSF